MQSDLFDKKIRDAADHHHPSYDEQAWKRMLHLLDKHLPQQPGNRRRFFFILLFLFLGGGGWLIISQPWQNNNPVTQNNPTTIPEKKTMIPPAGTPVSTEPVANTTDKVDRPVEKDVVASYNLLSTSNRRNDPLRIALPGRQKTVDNTPLKRDNGSIVAEEKTAEPAAKETIPNVATLATNTEPTKSNKVDMLMTKPTDEFKKRQEDNKQTQQPSPVINTVKNKKDRSKYPSPFFLSLSAGPDISFAEANELGNTRFMAGLGVGYTFRDRLTVRTGFYSSRKIYSADPDEYNPPAIFWTYYPYLQKVDANCKVYEIPLTVSYNFSRTPKKEWFVSGGLSTYLMKKEEYNYFFKYTATGPTHNRVMTHENDNNHFFSVVTLSGGYKRNLSDRVFVSAEPYLKLPVSGIGYGKVKLNSGGVQFSVGLRPFNTKKPVPVPR